MAQRHRCWVLVHNKDQLTDRRYLVDTSVSFSLVPYHSKEPPAKDRLNGPNGHQIRCWGEERRLCFGDHTFEWPFLQADVLFPILGVDFLHANKLLVNLTTNTLVYSSIGDHFSLTRQPSGYTASIMLPVNGVIRGVAPAPVALRSSHHMPPLPWPQQPQHRATLQPPL